MIQTNDESGKYARALFALFDDEKSGKIALSDFLVLTPFEIPHHDDGNDDHNVPDEEEKNKEGENGKSEEEVEAARRQRLIDHVDERTLELALDVFNRRAEKIDKEELFKVPYALCEASGADAKALFESDEQFAKKKFFTFDSDKLDKDEFLRLIRGCRRFLV